MIKVPANDLKPGMKLAKPVLNDGGMILLGEGTELTETHISRLQKMTSLVNIAVVGDALPGKSLDQSLAELDERFKKTENEPYMGTLKRVFREHIEELYK